MQGEIATQSMHCLQGICLDREPEPSSELLWGPVAAGKNLSLGIETKHKIGNTWPNRGACGLRQAETPENWVGQWMPFSWAQLQGIALLFSHVVYFRKLRTFPQIPMELTFLTTLINQTVFKVKEMSLAILFLAF